MSARPLTDSKRADKGKSAKRKSGLLVGLALMAGAVAPPPDPAEVVALLRAQDDAVLRVGERLIVGGLPYCTSPSPSAGMTIQVRAQYGEPYRAAATATFGLDDLPTVSGIAPGSAAEEAGLKVGDRLAAIDGHRFVAVLPSGKDGDFGPTDMALNVIEQAMADGSARLDLIRGGRSRQIVLIPRRACKARFDVRAGRSSNATSDGSYVQISSDLVAEVRNDGELAAILAHELAHNILRHPQRLKAKGPRPRVRDTEIDADRLSVYLLDAAGFSPDGAISFWERWGRAHDFGIFSDGSHPGWKTRIIKIRAEAAAIAAQRAAGQPIRLPPEL